MKHFVFAIKNFTLAKGRMTRGAFWQFMIINIFLYLIFLALDDVTLLTRVFRLFSKMYVAIFLVPTYCSMIRRVHDAGITGKWVGLLLGIAGITNALVLILFDSSIKSEIVDYHDIMECLVYTHIVSIIVLTILLSVSGIKGANKYGADPMEVIVDEVGGNAA
jgi:uncharacterized membrane protein YhaH (DUF805 family)